MVDVSKNVTQTGGTLIDKIADFIVPPPILRLLNITLYQNSFIVFNNWSFVHFFAGVIFYFFFPNMKFKKKFIIWIIINIIYEILEWVLALGGHPLFVEEFVDIVWDVIFSLLGCLVVSGIKNLIMKMKKKKK